MKDPVDKENLAWFDELSRRAHQTRGAAITQPGDIDPRDRPASLFSLPADLPGHKLEAVDYFLSLLEAPLIGLSLSEADRKSILRHVKVLLARPAHCPPVAL